MDDLELEPGPDGDRAWILAGGRRIAFLRRATLEQLQQVEDFGPRELVPAERITT